MFTLTRRLATGMSNNRTPLTKTYASKPPSYFSEHLSSPPAVNTPRPMFSHPAPSSQQTANPSPSSSPRGSSSSSAVRDLSIVISILALTYFAVDSYKTRIMLEQKVVDQSMAHMKGLAVAQNSFNVQRKKKEVQMLNERRNSQKREMKMVYHIAMLRKQLVDAGMKPVEIDEAIKEFEKNVKMETSISNVSGTALWVIDESPMKPYVPNTHDYETPGK